MKLRVRFILFFIFGLILFILATGMFVLISSEHLIPIFAGNNEMIANILNIAAILVPFAVGGICLGLFFVNPLVYMISLVRELSLGKYSLSEMNNKLYRTSGKLKNHYFLYRELIADIYTLAEKLEATEQERRKLEQEKTEWISGVSHDLKTPLSYITGYSSLLIDENKEWSAEEYRDFLNKIHEKSVTIKELIDDLNLTFRLDAQGKSYPLNKQTFDIVDFAKRLLADVATGPKAAEYEFDFESDEDIIYISADEKLLRRAIQNVVINAVLHNPTGTKISICANYDEKENQVIISVVDNGRGMTETEQQNLFHRYSSDLKDKDSDSSGLGLSVVKNIVESHGGTVLVESNPQKGTVVRLLFPINHI